MVTIIYDSTKHYFDKFDNVFMMSEKDVQFDTSYKVVNPKTNGSKEFTFSHSTGPEFDPETRWVYKNVDGFTLIVCNDKKITDKRAQMYLEAKTRQ